MSDRREDGTPVWEVCPSQELIRGVGGEWAAPVAPSFVRIPEDPPEWSPHRPGAGRELEPARPPYPRPERVDTNPAELDEIGARIYDR